ncbi:hypothetical protein R3P38DRAFT_3507985 [Favolaschia claudopus]|uniref:Uncharacterized protein n=1 Tax=Favolaschia claudopus TaxID=2862362 RepID=A0AAW0C2M5_9AGAR
MDDNLEFLFVDEPPLEPDDTESHLGNEPDFPALSNEATGPINEPMSRTNSRHLRAKLQPGQLISKVLAVLNTLTAQGLDLPIFLDALSWGDQDCISNKTVQYARTSLMTSEELPQILERWYRPPRHQSGGQRPEGGRRTLLDFSFTTIADIVDQEMKILAPLFLSPPENLSEEHLTDLDFESLKGEIQGSAPILWNILRRAASTEVRYQHKNKNPDMIILHMISQAQYSRSNRRGRIAKLWSIYLKACGLSARAFDALHVLGILMSHRWTAEAFETVSDRAMDLAKKLIHEYPWALSHDNINVPLRVFSQRLHNQSHFISGCAYTVWILPILAALPPGTNPLLQSFRAEHCQRVFDFAEVLYGDEETKRLAAEHVLRTDPDAKTLDLVDFFPSPHVAVRPSAPSCSLPPL